MNRDQFVDLIRENFIENSGDGIHRFRVNLLQTYLDTDEEQALLEAIAYYNTDIGCFFGTIEANCRHISRCSDCDIKRFINRFKMYYNTSVE